MLLLFSAQFTATKAGKTGLSDVAPVVYQITKAQPPVKTALSMAGVTVVETGEGCYCFVYDCDLATYYYHGTLTTADATVDIKSIAAEWLDWSALATAAISTAAASPAVSYSGAAAILKQSVGAMEQALANVSAMLATEALANVANPKASYTIGTGEGSQSVDWNGYRTAVMSQMAALVEQIGLTRQLINQYEPYIISTRMYT